MNSVKKFLPPLVAIAALVAAWQSYGWSGVGLVVTGIVMWILLHVNRMLHVMKKAAVRPKGYVDSAVMFNARLKPKVSLLHVLAMTESIGEALTPEGEDPESFRWTDESGSSVTCEFLHGKLVKWTLERPEQPEEPVTAEPPLPTP